MHANRISHGILQHPNEDLRDTRGEERAMGTLAPRQARGILRMDDMSRCIWQQREERQ